MSLDMLQQARSRDPDGRYEQLHSSSLPFDDATFDLVFQSCVAEEIPGIALMNEIFSEISRVLKRSGVVVVVTRDGAIGSGEWSSFVITEPEDGLRSGGQVKLFIREKNITLLDYVWFHSDFESVFDKSGLKILERHQPIATGEEPYHWYQELDKSFWNIYVLRKVADSTM